LEEGINKEKKYDFSFKIPNDNKDKKILLIDTKCIFEAISIENGKIFLL
jgi:hypothetical protein